MQPIHQFGKVLLCAFIVATSIIPIHADVTNLIASADTTLQEAFPDSNEGGGATIQTGGRQKGGSTRGLLQFDIAGNIPAGATILSATLTLRVVATPSGGVSSTFDLHRVLAAWGEGGGTDHNGGDPAQPGEATWNNRLHPNVPWTNPGGDFNSSASASKAVAGDGIYTFTSAGLAADVRFWLTNSANNFGWLLRSETETTPTTIRRFGSRTAPGTEPTLAINYSVSASPPATPPTMFGIALVGNQIRFSFNMESNRAYTVEFRDSLSNGNWSPLTNVSALPANTTLHITNTVSSIQRYFRIHTP